ncbi:membrane ATPase/protein kinase [compost metagenome]
MLGQGLEPFWQAVTQFRQMQTANGRLASRREKQSLSWMWERIHFGLKQAFHQHPQVQAMLPQTIEAVAQGRLPASTAARNLLSIQAHNAIP